MALFPGVLTCGSERVLHRSGPDEVVKFWLVEDVHPECVLGIDVKVAEGLVVGHVVVRV